MPKEIFSEREKDFLGACYDQNGGKEFDYEAAAETIGISSDEAYEVAMLLDHRGLIDAGSYGTKATFTIIGKEYGRMFSPKEKEKERGKPTATHSIDPKVVDFVAAGIEQGVQKRIDEAIAKLNAEERCYILALSHFAEANKASVHHDIRRVIPVPEKGVLESLARKRLVDQIRPARPFFWHLTAEGLRLVPTLNKWAADEKDRAAKPYQAMLQSPPVETPEPQTSPTPTAIMVETPPFEHVAEFLRAAMKLVKQHHHYFYIRNVGKEANLSVAETDAVVADLLREKRIEPLTSDLRTRLTDEKSAGNGIQYALRIIRGEIRAPSPPETTIPLNRDLTPPLAPTSTTAEKPKRGILFRATKAVAVYFGTRIDKVIWGLIGGVALALGSWAVFMYLRSKGIPIPTKPL
jgi:hypothetical protein